MSLDFIDQFLEFTAGARTPALFRLWSAISIVLSALERRVWIENDPHVTFPNMYILLVAPPGTGKSIIETAKGLLSDTTLPKSLSPAFHVSADSMTNASLIDSLAESTRVFMPPAGPPVKYSSLLVYQEEFSILVPKYDMEYIGTLNGIWMNKSRHKEKRRHGMHKETVIDNPQLNILSGVQPTYLASLFPEDAWTSGLGRRLFMVYSSESPRQKVFSKQKTSRELRQSLLASLGEMSMLWGCMAWEDEAAARIEQWNEVRDNDAPTHSKLQYYKTSRLEFALKLAIASSVARSRQDLTIRLEDIERSLGWMLEAERLMPDIFRAMVGRSDKDVLEELHAFVFAKFGINRKPVQGADMKRFLLTRVPHEKVESLIKVGEAAGLWTYVAGSPELWVPKARLDGGIE